jgi:hypothetical protein
MTQFIRRFSVAATLLGSLVFANSAFAYYTVLDNGEVMGQGVYKFTGVTQILTDEGGLDVTGMADLGLTDEFGARGLLGFGKTDFYVGGMFKWMPVPDIDNQPAVGFNGGLIYAHDAGVTEVTVRVEPLVSKRFNVEATVLTPYASLPIGIQMRNASDRDDKTRVASQMVFGSQVQIEAWKNLQFMGEVGINLDNSPSHIAAAAVLYFDESKGFEL